MSTTKAELLSWNNAYDYYLAGYRSEEAGALKDHFELMGFDLSIDEFKEFIEMLEDFESCEIPGALDFEELWVVRDEATGENGDIFECYFGSMSEAVAYAERKFQNFTRSEKKERHIIAGRGCYLYGWADGLGGTVSDIQTVVWDSLEGGDC